MNGEKIFTYFCALGGAFAILTGLAWLLPVSHDMVMDIYYWVMTQ